MDENFKAVSCTFDKNITSNLKYSFKDIRLPQYLKKDGYYTLLIGFVRLQDNKLLIPYSNSFRKTHRKIKIRIPPILCQCVFVN